MYIVFLSCRVTSCSFFDWACISYQDCHTISSVVCPRSDSPLELVSGRLYNSTVCHSINLLRSKFYLFLNSSVDISLSRILYTYECSLLCLYRRVSPTILLNTLIFVDSWSRRRCSGCRVFATPLLYRSILWFAVVSICRARLCQSDVLCHFVGSGYLSLYFVFSVTVCWYFLY